MKALLICDDHAHPGEVPIRGTAPLAEKGIDIEIMEDASYFDPAALPGYDVVIMVKCDHISPTDHTSWKTDAVQDAFIEYVENGGGLLVIHNGTVPGDNTQKLDKLAGCRFAFHPNDCPVTVQALKPHPITEGVEMFTEDDEHYRLEILAEDIDIFLASYAPPQGSKAKYDTEPYFNVPACISAAGYTRTQGKGRVCVLTPGHNHNVWANASFQRLVENAIKWCAN